MGQRSTIRRSKCVNRISMVCYTCGHAMWCHRMQNHEGNHADKRDDR